MHPLLLETSHRTAPMPGGPWVMAQTWHDLLFAHWAMPPDRVRSLVPQELELDLRDGQAYMGVVPFWMSGIRARFAPPLPGLSRFPELNVRTYVIYNGVPGVYFFSLDAANRVAVRGARWGYNLPYFYAAMSVKSMGEKLHYSSRRLEDPRPAEFAGSYWPVSPTRQREPGSLEHFVSERYCLYTVDRGRVFHTYIHHLPWPLQDAEADIEVNTMAQAAGITLPQAKPVLHFARFMEVLAWWPERA
ncbi:MAG TPA: DUF2071 domain-containing protein [Terriglobales bacterium]|nr:DUF2071 domain-containing protein [Terriglobales bacterium]